MTTWRCLSVWQPWAFLLAVGAKRFETRGWPCRHRGPIVIHAGARWDLDQVAVCQQPAFREVLEAHGVEVPGPDVLRYRRRPPEFLPLGAMVGAAVLFLDWGTDAWSHGADVPEPERTFGDWSPGRHAFEMKHPIRFVEPIPSPGRQGLFNAPPSVMDEIRLEVAAAGGPLVNFLKGGAA